MYHNIFSIDEISYLERKKKNESAPDYLLDNFDCYLPKLEKDFYYMVFLRKLLFDIDIMKVEYFLDFQYHNSDNQRDFIKTLNLKVFPSIEKIVNNTRNPFDGWTKFPNEIKLENDFVETEGFIKNRNYLIDMYYQWANVKELKEDITQRVTIVSDFIKKVNQIENNFNANTLSWCGKPSHLAFIIRTLVDEGYISKPLGPDKEINNAELSRQILIAFNVEKGGEFNTIKAYSNSDGDRYLKLKEKFENQGFNMPNSGFVG